jgi:two-component system response regulator NreC
MINILAIDDYSVILMGYKSIFTGTRNWVNAEYANDCESAYRAISDNTKRYDVIILDVVLKPFIDKEIWSGFELASIARIKPDCKIIIITSIGKCFSIYEIMSKVNPEGLLLKSDLEAGHLLDVLDRVIDGERYFSSSVSQCLKNINLHELDSIDQRIISLIAKGIKTKNLPIHLNLSISAIDKRKAQIKEIFDIEKGTDEDIIREAKRNGFI